MRWHNVFGDGRGFLYLVAIMGWHSRAVLAWRVSNTMETEFCVSALGAVLARFGNPEIFNTDQVVSAITSTGIKQPLDSSFEWSNQGLRSIHMGICMKSRFGIILIVLTCSILSGCGLQRWRDHQNAIYIKKECTKYDLQPGTPKYSSCAKNEKIKILHSDERFIQEMTND